jgi:hypothetical protein
MSLTLMRVWRSFLTRIGIPNGEWLMVDGQWLMNRERLHRPSTITHLPFTMLDLP